MPSLIELSQEMDSLLAQLQEEDEVSEETIARLERIEGDIKSKAGGYVAIIRNLQAEAESHEKLMKYHKVKQDVANRKIEFLKQRLKEVMLHQSIDKLDTDYGRVKVRTGGDHMRELIIDNEALVPEEFKRTEIKILKSDLKKAVMNEPFGVIDMGCHLGDAPIWLEIR